MLQPLKDEIYRSVSQFCADSIQRKTMLSALARQGFALDSCSECRSGVLTLNTYYAIKGSIDSVAISGAAAVELYMEAAFMFDSVADQDREDVASLTYAEELALALTLMCCGSAKASEAALLAKGTGSSFEALMHFYKSYSAASAGQFLDANFERSKKVSLKRALKMTSLKSGSLGKFAAGFGAAMATSDSKVINLFSLFGYNLLTYMQLIDDLKDAISADGGKCDFASGKKTVPLVFFSQAPTNEPRVNDVIMPKSSLANHKLLKSFDDSGAKLFTAVLAETYLNKAKSNLTVLAESGVLIERLEHFIKSVEFSPEELSVAS